MCQRSARRVNMAHGTSIKLEETSNVMEGTGTSPAKLFFMVKESEEEAANWEARQIIDQVKAKPDAILGLKTGGTAIPVYKEVIRLTERENVDWSKVVTFNLDEYVGISPGHPQSYRKFMDINLFNSLLSYGLNIKNTHVPDAETSDPDREMERYLQAIESMGGVVDLWVLSIGSDGHFGFLEPAIMMRKKKAELLASCFNPAELELSLMNEIRDFNEFIMPEKDMGSAENNMRKILELQKYYRNRLGSSEDLVRSRMAAAREYGVQISERDAKDQLDILGRRMLEGSEVTFYVPCSEKEIAGLKAKFTSKKVTIRPETEYFGLLGKVVSLALPTVIDNSRFFSDINEVPLKALTSTGIVKKSRRIIQIITGEKKAPALSRTLELPETPECPSTALKDHPDFTIICDKAAASLLSGTAKSGYCSGSPDQIAVQT